MAVDPRKLLYLAAIIEHGSFKKAARELEISQPALSTSMDRLEREIGEKLLRRGPTGVSTTPLGDLIYAHARLIREELERAQGRVLGSEAGDDGNLAFGALPSLAASVVPQAVCAWQKNHADITLRIVEKVQIELLLGLLRGEVDFIIGQTECYGFLDGLKQQVLFRDRLHVIGRPGHPAFGRDGLCWSYLAEFPWILPVLAKQRTLLEQLMAAEGIGLPRRVTECGSVTCITSMLAQSDSLALLPASAVEADVQQGRLRPLDILDPLLNRDIALIFRTNTVLSPSSRQLVADIRAAGLSLSRQEFSGPALDLRDTPGAPPDGGPADAPGMAPAPPAARSSRREGGSITLDYRHAGYGAPGA